MINVLCCCVQEFFVPQIYECMVSCVNTVIICIAIVLCVYKISKTFLQAWKDYLN